MENIIITMDNTPSLFSVRFNNVQLRNFKGQSSGLPQTPFTVDCSHLDDFKTQLFERTCPLLKREVLYDEISHTFSWAERELPDVDDLERYLLIRDTVGNRSFVLSSVTTNYLIVEKS